MRGGGGGGVFGVFFCAVEREFFGGVFFWGGGGGELDWRLYSPLRRKYLGGTCPCEPLTAVGVCPETLG